MNHGLADPAPGGTPGMPPPHPESPTPHAMKRETLQRTVTVMDPQGLHMRPAAAFAKLARQFQSTVTVRRDDRSVNGKSQLDLMLLAAEPGAQLVLEVSGEDAATALSALGAVLSAASFGEDEQNGPPPKG